MTDRELLELAAKAAGIKVCHIWTTGEGTSWASIWGKDWKEDITTRLWNPFKDDGDALRLAVKLELIIAIDSEFTRASDGIREGVEFANGDSSAATRRSIVRAAAEIGRSMP